MSHFLTFILAVFIALPSFALGPFHVQERGTETWIQLKFNPVASSGAMADVLFVVDDSASMAPHQANLQKNLEVFVKSIPQTSLQAGVITTTLASYSGSSFIPGVLINGVHKSTDPLFIKNLTKSLNVGVNGDGVEKPFDSIRLSLSEPLISSYNKDFIRPNADLYVVFLTDTQDQSALDENSLFSLLKSLKPQGSITSVAGMALDQATCKGEPDTEKMPTKIQNFVSLTGGSVFSLCGDFAKNITDAIKFSVITEKTLVLPGTDSLKTPIFSTIQVKIGTDLIAAGNIQTGWIYDSSTKTITFSDSVINKSMSNGPIEVSYQVQ
ncbi:hypothetical protein K2X05_00255 [bacterium]|nr:hypothetical protein [bacterium]